MDQNYFQFYQIPISFKIDLPALKKTYYKNSKQYHPDFHTLEDATDQEVMLRLSSFNNEAYKTLQDFDLRMAYILKLQGSLEEEGQNKLAPSFLMEMMDFNEALMELGPDPHDPQRTELVSQIEAIETSLYKEIAVLIDTYQGEATADLGPIKEYYLKKKYLLRLKSQI